jgi:hypothetical protein
MRFIVKDRWNFKVRFSKTLHVSRGGIARICLEIAALVALTFISASPHARAALAEIWNLSSQKLAQARSYRGI